MTACTQHVLQCIANQPVHQLLSMSTTQSGNQKPAMTGSCHCGAVSFTSTSMTPAITSCYCRCCSKVHGARRHSSSQAYYWRIVRKLTFNPITSFLRMDTSLRSIRRRPHFRHHVERRNDNLCTIFNSKALLLQRMPYTINDDIRRSSTLDVRLCCNHQ